METETKYILGGVVGVGLLILLFIFSPFTIIDSNERGVLVSLGKVEGKLDPGFHFYNSLTSNVYTMDVSVQKEEVEAGASSKDLQSVNAKIAVNYKLQESNVTQLYQQVKQEYRAVHIAPAIQEAVKASTAKYTAEELVTKREIVKDEIKANLIARLSPNFIDVTQVSITNFDFSEGFNQAIENKVKAEQQALEQKNKLEQVKYEAEQQIAKAKAEAESIRLQSNAADNDKYIELKRLDVQLEYAKKWNGTLPVNLYGSAPIPFLNLK